MLAISPDETLIAAAGQYPRLVVWSVKSKRFTRPKFELPTADANVDVEELVFSSDGSLLVSKHNNGEISVWKSDSGQLVGQFIAPSTKARLLTARALTAGRYMIVFSGTRGNIQILNLGGCKDGSRNCAIMEDNRDNWSASVQKG